MISINLAYDRHKDISLQKNPNLNHQPQDSNYFPLFQKQIPILIKNLNLLQLHMAEQKVMTF